MHRGSEVGERGVSPIVGVILMVGITVILGAVIAATVFGFSDELNEPAPVIGDSSGQLEPVDGGQGGIVSITHIAGDDVEAEDMEIAVDATDACGMEARIVDLPADSPNPDSNQFDEDNFEGDEDLLVQGHAFDQEPWDGGVLLEDNGNTFGAGTSFEFRISGDQDTGCLLDDGDELDVAVVHLPSDTAIITEEFEV